MYYPSEGGTRAPCAILLHELGGSRQHPGWTTLARKLQEGGFAVVQFDFRGHGESTAVDAAFWKVAVNSRLKNAAKKNQITYKDFHPGYLPMLANDVAAARRFLDLKNDLGECNSGNLVIIGAQEGATLGALWLAADGQRKAPKKSNPDAAPQNKPALDVAAAVWLSISPNFSGGKPTPILADNWLRPLRDKVAMAFLYGEEDKNSATLAQALVNQVLKADVPPRLKHTAAKSFKTRAAGIDLVSKVPGTDDKILNYLQNVLESRLEPAWWDRETKKRPIDFVNLKAAGIP